MDTYTEHDIHDLFGSDIEDVSPTQTTSSNALNIYPPLDATSTLPMPAPISVPADLSVPAPLLMRAALPMPTIQVRRGLWQVLQTIQRPGSATTDPSQLLQRFLDRQATAAAAPAAAPAPTRAVLATSFGHNVAVPTQRQPKANPPPPGAKISHARDKKSENRIGQYDWYDDFPVRANWTARDSNYAVQVKYSKQGELKPTVRFDRKTLETYIRGCTKTGIPLRLWIQNSATMHTDRFPSRASSICRAANCPVRNSTISRGMYQVCFDEYPDETTNGRYDPFYVAGYMHLFCLEEMIPLAELMAFADVQPDVREFPLEQRNPMSLNRDGVGRTLLGAYNEWKGQHYDRFVFNNLAIPRASHRKSGDCLYKHLTKKKMETQPSTRQKMRDQRNGFDISKHCGNLRKLMTHKADAKRKRRQAQSDSSDDGSQDADSDLEIVAVPPKRLRVNPQVVQVPAHAQTATPATPLRRSRRLSNAMAARVDATVPVVVPAPVPPMPVTYNPYGADFDLTGLNNYNMGGYAAPPVTQATRRASQGLNVCTDQATVNSLDGIDFSRVQLDVASDSFWAAYDQMMVQSRAVEPQTGVPPLPVCGASPQSPYQLRDTQARRESAVRLLSARTSQIQNNLTGGLIDPLLLQGTPKISFGPANPATPITPATPATPSRRVTRSMSRNVETPEQVAIGPVVEAIPIEEATTGETSEASTDAAAYGESQAYDEVFGDIDFGSYIDHEEFEQYLSSLATAPAEGLVDL
ncbi:hypothetical protein SEUCBS139899_006726 [Sporothrix eucalyptigena]